MSKTEKPNKYGPNGSASKTEEVIVGRLRALGERHGALVNRMRALDAELTQVRTSVIQAEGAINEGAETARALGIDLAKHFPASPPAAAPAPGATEGETSGEMSPPPEAAKPHLVSPDAG